MRINKSSGFILFSILTVGLFLLFSVIHYKLSESYFYRKEAINFVFYGLYHFLLSVLVLALYSRLTSGRKIIIASFLCPYILSSISGFVFYAYIVANNGHSMSYAVLFLYSCFYLYGGYGGFIGGIPFAIACFSYKYINNRNYLSHPPALQEKMLRRERFLTVLLGFTVFFSLTLFYFLDFSLFRDENHFIPGQIIQGEFDGDHRRFIQISNDGYYIIQDFKRGGVPTTNPYRIKNKDDLYKSYLDQWSIDGLYAYQDCDAGCEMRFINYRNGRKEGIEFGIFTNGNINGRRNFFHNLPDGEFITYYENGNKRSEGKMANRMNDMLITVWWPSGQKKMERELKNSRLVKEIVWYENGAKKKEGHGKPEYDYWVSWHKNGQISSESYWKKSLKSVGKCSEYGENGEILHKDETSQEICSKIYKKWIDDES